jgi:hypothetical protein
LVANPGIIVPRRLHALHHDVARNGNNCIRLTIAMLFDTDDDYVARIFGFGVFPQQPAIMEWFQRLRTADTCLQWGHVAGPMAVEAMKTAALAMRDGQGQTVERFYCDYWWPDKDNSYILGHAVVLEKDHEAPLGIGLHDYRECLSQIEASSDCTTELGGKQDALPPGQLYHSMDQRVTEEVARGQAAIMSLYWLQHPIAAQKWMHANNKKVDEQRHARQA